MEQVIPHEGRRGKAPRLSALSIPKAFHLISLHHRPLPRCRPYPSATTMATKQRLQAVLDARRASRPCWRCVLNPPRYRSISATGTQASSKSNSAVPDDYMPQQEFDHALTSIIRRTPSFRAESTTRSLNQSESGESETGHEPSIRLVETGHEPSIRLVETGHEPFIRHVETGHEPFIRHVAIDGPPVPLTSPSQSSPVRAFRSSHMRSTMEDRPSSTGPVARRIFPESENDETLPVISRYAISKILPQSPSGAARAIRRHLARRVIAGKGRQVALRAQSPFGAGKAFRKHLSRRVRIGKVQIRAVAAKGRKMRPLSQPEEARAVRKPLVRFTSTLKPLIRIVPFDRPLNFATQSQSISAKAIRKPRIRVVLGRHMWNHPIKNPGSVKASWERFVRIAERGQWGGIAVLPRRLISIPKKDTIARFIYREKERLMQQGLPGKNQLRDDELTSLLDESGAPMARLHNTTTRTGASTTTPRSSEYSNPSLQKFPRRPASNQIRMSDSQSLAFSGPSLSTGTGIAANRHHSTAAVSEIINAFGVSNIEASHRARLCRLMPQSTHPLSENIQMGLTKEDL